MTNRNKKKRQVTVQNNRLLPSHDRTPSARKPVCVSRHTQQGRLHRRMNEPSKTAAGGLQGVNTLFAKRSAFFPKRDTMVYVYDRLN